MNSDAVRKHLIDALEADLIGPFRRKPGETVSHADEVLRFAPSRWYLTGFLIPRELRDGPQDEDPDERDDQLDTVDRRDDDDASPDPNAKRRPRLPASIGLSVYLPPSVSEITASVTWADYVEIPPPPDPNATGSPRPFWSRMPKGPVAVSLKIDKAALESGVEVPGSNGLRLHGSVETIPNGPRTISVFLVNARAPTRPRDTAYAFQVRLELECNAGFVGLDDASDGSSSDTDDQILDLQYRGLRTYAVGHGISAHWDKAEGAVTRIATTWLPRTTVPRVEANPAPGVMVDMETLSGLSDSAAVRSALGALADRYGEWIQTQREVAVESPQRAEVKEGLLRRMEEARRRISAGVELLATDARALRAFRIANRAMAIAQRRRSKQDKPPSWRLFQLAFVVMNLPGVSDPSHPDRKTVELIFFPTGGGKTEAYLGLIAYTLVLRRLMGAERPDGGLGVAVILRYTLRLLTLDQLARAATLICSLEVLRKQGDAPGDARYAIGLWVGRSATANTLEQAAKAVTEYKNDTSPRAQSPFPLTHCPWCGKELNRDGFVLRPNKTHPEEIAVGCVDLDCDFRLQADRDGLPVLFVDEQLYRELPCFLLATVDKFALLPWRGETGMLFGRATSREGKRFFGPCDGPKPAYAKALPEGLRPPEIIVQDELHLISGPLGSMVGLYETAVDLLCPNVKLIASTATVRRAARQIQLLYGRSEVCVFPPTGLTPTETFFSRAAEGGERLYLGLAAGGRPTKAVLLRVYVVLLAAAYKLHDPKAKLSPADPYLTLVGYFNSLRELGGMRRLVEDEVRRLALKRADRRPQDFPDNEPNPWFRNRPLRAEPLELTSRESQNAIKDTKSRLERPWGDKDAVDVLLASNMISVGVDIDRLGLMVIAGQPKTTSEYIQSSSRVGRNKDRPGLVVTVLNVAKPRDRSHYERFVAYHRCFYRMVEATSVTPWSAPALDRGLAGVAVASARLADPALTAPVAVMTLAQHRQAVERLAAAIAEKAGIAVESESAREQRVTEVRQRLSNILDAWQRIVAEANSKGADRSYSPLEPEGKGKKSLLYAHGDDVETREPDELKFEAPLSMRDVEPSVHLWVTKQPLGGRATRG